MTAQHNQSSRYNISQLRDISLLPFLIQSYKTNIIGAKSFKITLLESLDSWGIQHSLKTPNTTRMRSSIDFVCRVNKYFKSLLKKLCNYIMRESIWASKYSLISPDARTCCEQVAETFQDHFAFQAGAGEQLMMGNEEKPSALREPGNAAMGEGSFPAGVTEDPLQGAVWRRWLETHVQPKAGLFHSWQSICRKCQVLK